MQTNLSQLKLGWVGKQDPEGNKSIFYVHHLEPYCTVGINFKIVVKSLSTIFAQKPSAWVAAKHPHNGQIITGRYTP